MIAESHISVHTFPDRSYVNIDVFSCKDFDHERVLERVKDLFGLDQVKLWVIGRGLDYSRPNFRSPVRRGQLRRAKRGGLMASGHPSTHPISIPWSFLAIAPEETNAEDCRVVVLPVPYDSTTSYMGGTREGPRAIIEASRHLEDYDIELQREVYRVGIHTLPELEPHVGSPEGMVERVQAAVEPFARDGKLVTVLGGEHTVSVGAAKAFRKFYPDLSVLYLDAHADLRDEYMGSRFSHACAARRYGRSAPWLRWECAALARKRWTLCGSRDFRSTSTTRARRSGLLGRRGDNIEPLRASLREHRPGRA